MAASKQYGAVAANAQTTNYGYNQTSMLTSESAPAKSADLPALSQSYSFDAMGNRTQWSDGVAKTLTNAVYNRLNQLTVTSNYNNTTPATPVLLSTSAFGYDGDGNMTNVATTTANTTTNGVYRYDDASRLIAIETPGVSKTEFFYDGRSRLRISKTFAWQDRTWTQNGEIHRVYTGMDAVQERDVNNVVTASYATTGHTNGMLARSTSNGNIYYGYDGAGNVTTLTDNSGAQSGSYTYDAWGNTVASSGTKAGENPYRYSTKESIGGLYYYGFRFYSPGLGRWINRDPIRENGGVNVYGFVENNPTNFIDWLGLVAIAPNRCKCSRIGGKWGSYVDTTFGGDSLKCRNDCMTVDLYEVNAAGSAVGGAGGAWLGGAYIGGELGGPIGGGLGALAGGLSPFIYCRFRCGSLNIGCWKNGVGIDVGVVSANPHYQKSA